MANPVAAAILSFFIVGLGQFYSGRAVRGLAWFVSAVILAAILSLTVVGVVLVIPVWLANIYDAYKVAKE